MSPQAILSPELVEACAHAAHEANRAYCFALGDSSQPPWSDAPAWQQASARSGIGPALGGATPEQSHAGWLAEKIRDGWRWGPVKSPETKEHPCMVPYEELPPEQRAKDRLYLATVRAVAAALVSASARSKAREPGTKISRSDDDAARELVVAAGLNVQHRCAKCDRLLFAWGRSTDELWTCAPCAVPGATVSDVYDLGGSS